MSRKNPITAVRVNSLNARVCQCTSANVDVDAFRLARFFRLANRHCSIKTRP